MKNVWTTVKREPLVHFALLAGVLFAADYWFASEDRETILITQEIVAELIRLDQQLQPDPVTEERRQELIESFIEDEILVRESYRRGLDRDSRVRSHLTMKMRLLLSEDAVEPTPSELRVYFQQNKQRYSLPPSVVIEHVYYPKGVEPDDTVLQKLLQEADPKQFGEPLGTLGSADRAYSLQDLAFYTDASFARLVFDLPVDQWKGPIESSRGQHFVRVMEKHPARHAEFENVADFVQEDWKFSSVREGVSRKIDEMRQQYNVVIETE